MVCSRFDVGLFASSFALPGTQQIQPQYRRCRIALFILTSRVALKSPTFSAQEHTQKLSSNVSPLQLLPLLPRSSARNQGRILSFHISLISSTERIEFGDVLFLALLSARHNFEARPLNTSVALFNGDGVAALLGYLVPAAATDRLGGLDGLLFDDTTLS